MSSSSDNEVLVAMLTTDTLEGKGEPHLFNGHFERQLRDRRSSEELSWPECHRELMKLRDAGDYTEDDICNLLGVDCNFGIELMLTRTGHNLRFTDSDTEKSNFLLAARRAFSNLAPGTIPERPERSKLQIGEAIIAKSAAGKDWSVLGIHLLCEGNVIVALWASTLAESDQLDRQLDVLCADLKTQLELPALVLKRDRVVPW